MGSEEINQTSIKHSALDALFPMHVVLDRDGLITHIGPTLLKIMHRDLCGTSFFEAFTIKKPRSIRSLSDLNSAHGRKVVIHGTRATGNTVEFRCMPTKIGDSD